MKRIVPFILLFVALLLPSTVFADIIVIPPTAIAFGDPEQTTFKRLSPGRFKVEMIGFSGVGTVNGYQEIIWTFKRQSLRADINSGIVRGRALGEIDVKLATGEMKTLRFRGDIKGRVTEIESNGDKKLEMDIRLRARLLDANTSDLVGIMEFYQLVVINKPVDRSSPILFQLGGSGTLAFFDIFVDIGE